MVEKGRINWENVKQEENSRKFCTFPRPIILIISLFKKKKEKK
jgi:hypothetical protein